MNNILYGILKEEENRLNELLKIANGEDKYRKLDKEKEKEYIDKIKDNLNEVKAAIDGIDEYRGNIRKGKNIE